MNGMFESKDLNPRFGIDHGSRLGSNMFFFFLSATYGRNKWNKDGFYHQRMEFVHGICGEKSVDVGEFTHQETSQETSDVLGYTPPVLDRYPLVN